MHDFALTPSYVVLFDLPVTSGLRLPYTWNPGHQARVGLVARDDTAADVRWFEVDPRWVFHTLNAYDDGGRVVVDLVRYAGACADGSGEPTWQWSSAPSSAVKGRKVLSHVSASNSCRA